ncbi:trimeric intracellular cation channel family protein [Baekduia sp. Peel2402]|uniref:trimeric intracellular cation channel family protein n=1 Tax=Baekduia sp. Peel2402 TaxID=3458296 RepID=UPI00403E487F
MAAAVHVPLWIDLAAVAVGAMQGGAFAARSHERNEFDLLGVAVFALAIGLGGGILRDVLLDVVPAALRDDRYLVTALLAGLAGMLAADHIPRLGLAWEALDAVVVGLFVVVGCLKASQSADVTAGATILLGAITGVGGSVLRDLLAQQPVALVQRTTPYALVAILGAAMFVALDEAGARSAVCGAACLAVVFVVRLVAVARGWRSPAPRVASSRAVNSRAGR